MEPDSGNCQNSYSRYFYYNKHTDTCEYMAYGGCGGNLNRFDTLQECEKRCRNTKTTKDGKTIITSFYGIYNIFHYLTS